MNLLADESVGDPIAARLHLLSKQLLKLGLRAW
jgi:hypothetical protein